MAFTGFSYGTGLAALGQGFDALDNAVSGYQKQQTIGALGQSLAKGDYDTAMQLAPKADPTGALSLKILGMKQANTPDPLLPQLAGVQPTAPVSGASAASTDPAASSYKGGPLKIQLDAGVDPNNMDPASPIIASMEGAQKGYSSLGPTTADGDKAYGIHQVMGKNVGPWTQEALGRSLTPQEFLANPQAQEQVFAHKFNQYRTQFGDDSKAAQAWFAGPGGVGTNRQDILGTSVPEYANRFTELNRISPAADPSTQPRGLGPPPAGTAVASNDPPVVINGKQWTRASAAATETDDSPEVSEVAAAQAKLPGAAPQRLGQPPVVATDTTSSGGDQTDALRQHLGTLNLALAKYTNAGNKGGAAAVEKMIAQTQKQLDDQKDSYSIHTLPTGDMVAISKTDPTNVVPINTGAKPKSQAEYDTRNAIADQEGLTGDQRRNFVLNGKVPDNTHVLKPRDVLADSQGKTLAQNTSASSMTDQTADFLAERVLAGDTKALIGLGRGAQGAENLAKIQSLVSQKAADRGIDANDMLHNAAVASGMGAQERTFGTQTARMATASTEAEGAINLARQSSADISRTGFIPLTKLIQMGQTATNNPQLAKFVAANNTVINTFARAVNPNGQPHDSDKQHAREMLSTAQDPETYNAVLDQLQKEIDLAHQAPAKASTMLNQIRQQGKTQQTGGVVPPAEGATATGPNGAKVQLRGGQWVPLQ